jgi:small neutral amino acid transporter SnatA (MarC family)
MDECLRIYQAKEKAALQIRKPLAYLLTLYILYLALRTFVHAWALRYQRRDVDPNMVETYQAFNMLIRQIKRGMKPTSRSERHEE